MTRQMAINYLTKCSFFLPIKRNKIAKAWSTEELSSEHAPLKQSGEI